LCFTNVVVVLKLKVSPIYTPPLQIDEVCPVVRTITVYDCSAVNGKSNEDNYEMSLALAALAGKSRVSLQ
jgi:hypothetical protein